MRIIYTSNNQKDGAVLSNFLKSKGIDNQLEIQTNSDWGNPDYGVATCHIWVIDEDSVDESIKWRDEFEKNPNNPAFTLLENPLKNLLEPLKKTAQNAQNEEGSMESTKSTSMGFITLYILMTCILLFMLGAITTPHITKLPERVPFTPLITAPINKALMYDYPKAFEIIDEIVTNFGLEKTEDLSILPKEANALVIKFNQTPYWQGIYEKIVLFLQNPKAKIEFNAPMFEKIQQGEVWRLFTPALLHASIFHIFFNMILFVILGKQMELKIGSPKFLLFILLTGIFSNTAQYLMTGSAFLGLSGVICAMIGFIFMRQRFAAWEGYQFTSISLSSVVVFITLMVILQLFSFVIEVFSQTAIAPGIANTAHLAGLFIGTVLGLTNLFKLKN